ncbi:heavy metal translocating P-type ATPase, partial [Mesorhizobium sp. M7A.F.Ca.AU.002.02.1.1]
MTAPLDQVKIRQTRFKIGGMDCASCATKIDTAVRRLDGVADVSVSVTGASMTVSHGGALPEGRVLQQVARLGYGIVRAEAHVSPMSDKAHADHVHNDHEGHDHASHDPDPDHGHSET